MTSADEPPTDSWDALSPEARRSWLRGMEPRCDATVADLSVACVLPLHHDDDWHSDGETRWRDG